MCGVTKAQKLPDPKPTPIPLSNEQVLDNSGNEIANRRRRARGFASNILSTGNRGNARIGRVALGGQQ